MKFVLILLFVTVAACAPIPDPVPVGHETMLAWIGDIPQDQGQWNQYQMEIEERQYQYQKEEAERQAREYQEQVERCCPYPRGHYGYAGEPLLGD